MPSRDMRMSREGKNGTEMSWESRVRKLGKVGTGRVPRWGVLGFVGNVLGSDVCISFFF